MSERIICGDAFEVLKTMESESVDCVITSPPYWGLRDYGVAGQLGLEKTPEEFIEKMVAVFAEVKRVLKKSGTLWLNIGDSYVGTSSKGEYRDPKYRDGRNGQSTAVNNKVAGLKSKDLVGIPWMLAFALRADGWYLRQDIIWSKPNPMPESVQDRCTKAHEYVFLLAKSRSYYFEAAAIKEISKSGPVARPAGWATGPDHSAKGWQTTKNHPKTSDLKRHSGNPKADSSAYLMANKRSVWSVNSQPFSEAHFATFPEKLVEPMVMAGCPEGGTILDPFSGAATTGLVAKKLGRNYIGIELNPEYVALSERRLNSIPSSLFTS